MISQENKKLSITKQGICLILKCYFHEEGAVQLDQNMQSHWSDGNLSRHKPSW
jgi:hypothetical protein